MTTADSTGALIVEGDLTQYDHLVEPSDNGPDTELPEPDQTPELTAGYDGPEL